MIDELCMPLSVGILNWIYLVVWYLGTSASFSRLFSVLECNIYLFCYWSYYFLFDITRLMFQAFHQ
uniref:Uncharacterized protein n=1 Tax=Oryza brachyantha TaxID=4533 RepID=J3LE74_ORYBR